MYAWYLKPVSRDGSTNLNERRANRASILWGRMIDHNLLNLNKVGDKPKGADSSFNVSCSCMMSTSSGNDNNVKNCAFKLYIFNYFNTYWSVYSNHGWLVWQTFYFRLTNKIVWQDHSWMQKFMSITSTFMLPLFKTLTFTVFHQIQIFFLNSWSCLQPMNWRDHKCKKNRNFRV